MKKPRLLDLFCCAGGAAMGYARAGFEVVGVDIHPQPRYPFAFFQEDALMVLAILLSGNTWHGYLMSDFAVIHASPPCHLYSCTHALSTREKPDLVPVIREKLEVWGGPWVIENVPGAPMQSGVILCGTMFHLKVFRHRYFESSHFLFSPGQCFHDGNVKRFHKKVGEYITVVGHDFRHDEASEAMGIDWMINRELSQAIPPAYTEWIGRQLMEVVA